MLINGVGKLIKNKTSKQKGGFLSMLLGTLGASLLGNLLTGKDIFKAGEAVTPTSHVGGTIIAGQEF